MGSWARRRKGKPRPIQACENTHRKKKRERRNAGPAQKKERKKRGLAKCSKPAREEKKVRETNWASPPGKSKKNEAKKRPKMREREVRRKSTLGLALLGY